METNIICIICNNKYIIKDTLIPAQCLRKNGKKAHRICIECWFNKFALEDISHNCLGCINKLSLNNHLLNIPELIPIEID